MPGILHQERCGSPQWSHVLEHGRSEVGGTHETEDRSPLPQFPLPATLFLQPEILIELTDSFLVTSAAPASVPTP